MSAINENNDCPICMDVIDGNNNRVTTECGHYFHTNCLMNCVAHNGFGCPYCRSNMVEEQEHDVEDSSYCSDWDNEDERNEDERNNNDYALRGFRFFMNNLDYEPHASEDIEEEEEYENDEEIGGEVPRPTPFQITTKLIEQGVNMEQLVKILLLDHNDVYELEYDEFSRISDEMFGKMRIIISNYQHVLPQ